MTLKKRTILLCLLAALLPALFGITAAAQTGRAAEGGTLRAMSFNVLRGDLMGPDHLWELRRDACLEMLSVRRPDILGTVECNSVQKADILAANPQFGAVGVAVNGQDRDYPKTSANLIYYNREKFTLEDWGTVWLSDTPDTVSNTYYYKKPRTATWARFKLTGRDAHFVYVCVHLQDNSSSIRKQYADRKAYYGSECRRKEMDVLLGRLPQINPEGAPMLLGGDLNCISAAEELFDLYGIMDLVALNSTKTDLGNTFNGFKTPEGRSRIDHLFSSKCSHSLFAVDRDAYAGVTYLSDHFPIYTDFTIE